TTVAAGATAPAVSSTTPADGATAVPAATNVKAVFSAPMNAATITTSSFTLTASGATSGVAATVAYDAASNTVTLMPSAPLASGTAYTARLDTTVRGGNGAALASAYTWSFTTTARSEEHTSELQSRGHLVCRL